MADKVKKIGWEKASLFNKNFDKIYDFWKKKAEEEYNYYDDLKLIKEHNKVLIYIKVDDIDQYTDRPDWEEDDDNNDDLLI
jgi:predicted enzyme related to lactoylglutathione lyase